MKRVLRRQRTADRNNTQSNKDFLLAIEGGGTRSQAAVLDGVGQVLAVCDSSDVNANFIAVEQAQQALIEAVKGVLDASEVPGEAVSRVASALVGSRFDETTCAALLPKAAYQQYSERDVIFARAGIYRPHGVAVVAATGATAFGVRGDDGRQVFMGGWGSLLGDEGSAYALGLLGLRSAARAFEGRLPEPTRLVEAACQHFRLHEASFRPELVSLAYQKPLSRAEIAGFAVAITCLAQEGDAAAIRLAGKVASDLAALALEACRRLFTSSEIFDLVVAGGLTQAGDLILAPLKQALAKEFPQAIFSLGREQPAVALGRLALWKKKETANLQNK
jgi:N-acetylglucosamine kinase-like BadF-type ATPase